MSSGLNWWSHRVVLQIKLCFVTRIYCHIVIQMQNDLFTVVPQPAPVGIIPHVIGRGTDRLWKKFEASILRGLNRGGLRVYTSKQ